MLLDPGQLDRRVQLFRMQRTRLDTGEEISQPVLYATVWAQKRDASFSKRWAAHQLAAQVDTSWLLQWRPNLSPLCELRCEGVRYDVIGVLELGRREGYDVGTSCRAELGGEPR